ncbi:hypothetical protein [Caenimonas sedimenti]|uniref:hypothetical protein n=1 Tax=Caenimonas sedimenti TaxID=2596921 RepID=UPI0016460CEF|nr:hypothetical protein [Caenimonas sedimenti]
MSRALDAMVELDLVSKDDNPADARGWTLSLTLFWAGAGSRKLKVPFDGHAANLLCRLR